MPPYLLEHVDLLREGWREVGQHPTWEGEPLPVLGLDIYIPLPDAAADKKKAVCGGEVERAER